MSRVWYNVPRILIERDEPIRHRSRNIESDSSDFDNGTGPASGDDEENRSDWWPRIAGGRFLLRADLEAVRSGEAAAEAGVEPCRCEHCPGLRRRRRQSGARPIPGRARQRI